MDHVRCVIANIPQRLLADIVANIAKKSGPIKIVKILNNADHFQTASIEDDVDLLLLGVKGIDFPNACFELMDKIPHLAVLGLVDDGRRLVALQNDVGVNDILRVIRALCRLDA
jgi:hypothetical protein